MYKGDLIAHFKIPAWVTSRSKYLKRRYRKCPPIRISFAFNGILKLQALLTSFKSVSKSLHKLGWDILRLKSTDKRRNRVPQISSAFKIAGVTSNKHEYLSAGSWITSNTLRWSGGLRNKLRINLWLAFKVSYINNDLVINSEYFLFENKKYCRMGYWCFVLEEHKQRRNEYYLRPLRENSLNRKFV